MSRNSRIAHQIDLLEELRRFLALLQERLLEAKSNYDSSLQKIEAQGMFLELLEKQRDEYFAVTEKEIEDIIELIEGSDKPYVDKVIDRLEDLRNT